MAYESQQPNNYNPAFLNVTTPSTTWGASPNTCTITDASIHPTSNVLVTPTGIIPAGFWKFAITQGQLVITSSDSENSAQGINYIVF